MKGWSELLLLGAVLVAAWTRTPVGALARSGWAWAHDAPAEDLLASFRTALPSRLADSVARLPTVEIEPPAVEQGWSPALRTAITAQLGEAALLELEASGEADPERALELRAVGAEARDRAVARARAAGEAAPERLRGHHRFLPAGLARKADEEVGDVLSLATALDLRWPVEGSPRVTSPFGYRTHPVLGDRRLHEGLDIGVPVGTPVFAAAPGRVSRARESAVSGLHVILDHGHGVTTAYCHGSRLDVAAGAGLGQGAPVMASGNTGRSTGPHLHFGLRIGGRPVDPRPFLPSPPTAAAEGPGAAPAGNLGGPTGVQRPAG